MRAHDPRLAAGSSNLWGPRNVTNRGAVFWDAPINMEDNAMVNTVIIASYIVASYVYSC